LIEQYPLAFRLTDRWVDDGILVQMGVPINLFYA
jgi:hypothetical protein